MYIFKLILCFMFCLNCINNAFAYEYSESDKQMFYNAFIDGYIIEMQKVIDTLDVEETKKDKFMQTLKNNIDEDYLKKSSWECIKKFPVESIVSASILCTAEWNKKQSEKNQKLFETLK